MINPRMNIHYWGPSGIQSPVNDFLSLSLQANGLSLGIHVDAREEVLELLRTDLLHALGVVDRAIEDINPVDWEEEETA